MLFVVVVIRQFDQKAIQSNAKNSDIFLSAIFDQMSEFLAVRIFELVNLAVFKVLFCLIFQAP